MKKLIRKRGEIYIRSERYVGYVVLGHLFHVGKKFPYLYGKLGFLY